MVVESGNDSVGKSGKKVGKGLCGPQHTSDFLTKSRKLTNIYKQKHYL